MFAAWGSSRRSTRPSKLGRTPLPRYLPTWRLHPRVSGARVCHPLHIISGYATVYNESCELRPRSYLHSHFNILALSLQVFTAGYTNKLIGCSVSPEEVVLVRIYGHRTDLLIDRDKERNSMVILHAIGCAAPLYCRFDNGIAYGYLPGIVLNVDLARNQLVRR